MKNQTIKFAYFGSGCFWCSEAIFKNIKGVISTWPGYAGGQLAHPNYEQVCTGETGQAEVLRIEYDPEIITFEKLLEIFFVTHDPTTINRQGNDVGTQYRSIILYTDEEQRSLAQDFIAKIAKDFSLPIVTELRAFEVFYEAEEYHHDYFAKNPQQAYCQMVINPKLTKFKAKYSAILNI
jgi:peptide-methionine (S)-S-oxide reductase